jgi:hypothetical protein
LGDRNSSSRDIFTMFELDERRGEASGERVRERVVDVCYGLRMSRTPDVLTKGASAGPLSQSNLTD